MTLLARLLVLLSPVLLAATSTAVPAPAAGAPLVIPVNCAWGDEDGLELSLDGATYQVEGVCGTVRITADDAVVSMPTAAHLYVVGARNQVVSKQLGEAVVGGDDNRLQAPSLTALSVTGARASITVAGLAEAVHLRSTGSRLTADRTHELVVQGQGTAVTARRGFDTVLLGAGNSARHRRLDRLRIEGSGNLAVVDRGRTQVAVRGSGNRVRVHRRD